MIKFLKEFFRELFDVQGHGTYLPPNNALPPPPPLRKKRILDENGR